MPKDRSQNGGSDEPEYRVYRAGGSSGGGVGTRNRSAGRAGQRGPDPGAGAGAGYRTYRSQPRGLLARLRGESDAEVGRRQGDLRPDRRGRRNRSPRRGWTWLRVLKYAVLAVVAWVVLSFVLFMISAQNRAGNLPAGAESALTSGGPMLTSANTILIVGLDNRPTTGAGSKEGGLQSYDRSERYAHTDTIMLWRIGGGVSRRLSIPRDTVVNVPGQGQEKINAAWSQGGPALTIKTIERLTGVSINHMIVIDLANFPKFIDDIGGVTVKTPRICSNISGGRKNGGFTLYLRPGYHHLTGLQAMVLARTRDNSCNPAYSDLNRELEQQQILNGIKSQLFSAHAFLHLPWAAWDAPSVIQTDMGGLSLMQLFIAAEIGGAAPTHLLTPVGPDIGPWGDGLQPPANAKQITRRILGG
ncbi:MAG TPA: LCP family protein [Solirubrobacteraceae bacterium]|nr:LCP family protein [Solirubrobacteraceae bacterium]